MAAPSRPMRSQRRSAIRRCRTCRPPRKPACRSTRPRPGTRFSRRRARRAPILAKLNAAVVKALDDENVRKRLLDLGSDIPKTEDRTPEALAALVKSEIAKWTAGAQAGDQLSRVSMPVEPEGGTQVPPLPFAAPNAHFSGYNRWSRRIGAVGSPAWTLGSPPRKPQTTAMNQYHDLLERILCRRRGKARPHRHRHAVGVRPSDALQSGRRAFRC